MRTEASDRQSLYVANESQREIISISLPGLTTPSVPMSALGRVGNAMSVLPSALPRLRTSSCSTEACRISCVVHLICIQLVSPIQLKYPGFCRPNADKPRPDVFG